MLGSVFYNGVIRKTTIAFASIFKDVVLIRENANGTEDKRVVVPVNFGDKEKFQQRLEGDPSLDRKFMAVLPRIAIELKSIDYDSTRKQNTYQQNLNRDCDGIYSQYNPVPYNFNFQVSIHVRNIEDGNQIVEQILPYFTPSYTLSIKLISEMDIVRPIPFFLNSVDYYIDSDGDSDENTTRDIVWTLNFTGQGWIFGPVFGGTGANGTKIIKEVITHFYDDVGDHVILVLDEGTGDYLKDEIVYQGLDVERATATAKVVAWSNSTSRLEITQSKGKFVTNESIKGSSANFPLLNYEITRLPLETMTVTPNPPTANGWTQANGIIVTITTD